MPLIQNSKILYEQNRQIFAVYNKGQKVWPATLVPPDPRNMPFSVRNMESTSIEFPAEPGYSFSLVEGEWENVYESGTITLDPGDTVRIRWVSQPRTSIDSSTFPWPSNNPRINIGGNIMSLLDGNNFVDLDEVGEYAFMNLFQNKAVDIDDLVLPATTLNSSCYRQMFWNCTSLTKSPELPATILSSRCYDTMFQSCTSLTTAPALSATTLAQYCYCDMFRECTSLVNVPSTLPATTLANNCYAGMFRECTLLTTAPVLPATTLVNSCYADMFRDDNLLSSVTCLATSGINTNSSTSYWLSNVSSTGTFTKAAGVTWPEGSNGIPSGWTVVEV